MLLLLLACGDPPVVVSDTPPPAEARQEGMAAPTVDGESATMQLSGFSVRIAAHSVGEVPLWTLVSDGLQQQQVAFSVRRDRQVDLNPLLMFMQSAFDQGIRGAPGVWELHGMGPDGPGFLANKRFFTVLFAPPVALDGVPGTDRALAGILLDTHETEWLYRIGPQRMLARLGRLEGQVPTTVWADPSRAMLVPPDFEATGPVLTAPTAPAASLEVTEVGGELRLAIGRPDLARIRDRGSLKKPGTLRILGGRAPDATGVLVQPFDGEAVVHGASGGPLALNGLFVDVGPEAVGRIEDLARVTLPPDRWDAFWTGLEQRGSMVVGGKTIRFVEPGFAVSAPPPQPETPRDPAKITGFEMTLSEAEVMAIVDDEALRTAIGLMEVEMIDHATRTPAPVPSMHVQLQFQPDGTMDLQPQWTNGPADPAWWGPLETRLRTVPPPAVKAPLAVRLAVSFG
ncbi:MAG: hypothetical protein KC656_07535 [Myxococcales bacterium]|nr:hypothetical protein [Myxococcales bacterium]MCB9692630.1 hypothetical protein [Alphaproteobacteria bacterium]